MVEKKIFYHCGHLVIYYDITIEAAQEIEILVALNKVNCPDCREKNLRSYLNSIRKEE